ncbi:MAG: DUF5684 domain-containing protein [Actinobacteria bacterium]|nr:DUF5684 domain-containing protein [Actinomycetota bacterium]
MLSLLAQNSSSGGAAGGLVGLVLSIGFTVLILASMWKIFAKMTQPGWYGIIPIFNYCVIAKQSGKDWWWGLLPLVPCIGIIFLIILWNELSKLFGKGVGYTIGIIFLPFIFLPMLAFGSAEYQGPQGKAF